MLKIGKNAVVILLISSLLLMSPFIANISLTQPPSQTPPMYWKGEFPDYAPSGMPDFDQKQDAWNGNSSGQWTYCGPVAVANSLWWLDSEFEPGAVQPPTKSDGFGLVTAYGSWDDHDPQNVPPLVNDLASFGKTDPNFGTEVHDLKQGIDQYLNAKGMNAYFYTHLYKQPTFELVEREVERCQDVVLLLGFWQQSEPGVWNRTGGHYVTVAGINSSTLMIAFSDPFIDAAEPAPHGIGSMGNVLPPPPHPHPPAPPDTLHNNATYVSQDIYMAGMQSPSPGGLWYLPDYTQFVLPISLFSNFDRQNFPVEYLSSYKPFDPLYQVCTEVEYAIVTSPWFAKGQYEDYAPSGMPDFDERQNITWTNPWLPNPGSWSYCGPAAVGNSLWWYDSKFEPNPVPPPTINDGFGLVKSYSPSAWDDHDPNNVQPLIQNLAWYMDTDGQRTGLTHCGTDVFDMQAGIAQYLSDMGVNPPGDCNGDGVVNMADANIVGAAMSSVPGQPKWDLRADVKHDNIIDAYDMIVVGNGFGLKWGKFYEKTQQMPDPGYLEHQIKMCEDVVLLLGFWQEFQPGYFIRIGGHFVTAHGIDLQDMTIAISDPIQDNAENGGQGKVIPPAPHPHPVFPPDTVHNDARFVSHDYYTISPSPSPGGHWGLDYNWTNVIGNFYGQNTPHNYTEPQEPYMGLPVFVEIEYAVVVSCRGGIVAAGSEDSSVCTFDFMGNLLWTYTTNASVVSVAMSERGEYVVAGALNDGLYVFDGATGTLLWWKNIPISESYDGSYMGSDSKTVDISADGSYIVAATWNGLYLYDNAGTLIWQYMSPGPPEETCVKISADGKYIVCCAYNTGEVHFFSHLRNSSPGWQLADGSPIWSTLKHAYWVAIDACGRYAAFSGDADSDGYYEVYLYRRSGAQIWNWEFTRMGFVRVDMPWDGRAVVAVNDDLTDSFGTELVYFSDTRDGTFPGWSNTDGIPYWVFVPSPDAGTNDFYSVRIAPEGEVIATGPSTSNIYLLAKSGAPIQTIPDGTVQSLDLTFTGEYGVDGDRQGNVRFYAKTRNVILWSYGTQGKINSVAIQKKYPCLEPFPYHDVDASGIALYQAPGNKPEEIVHMGFPSNEINVTLSNHGNFTETVEVTLYAYSSQNNTMVVVGSQVVTIAPGATPVVGFIWTPTNVPYYGNYTMVAAIGPVQDENDLVDNEVTDGGLVVVGAGDVKWWDGGRIVDLYDALYFAGTFNKRPWDPEYVQGNDIKSDKWIDIYDAIVLAGNYNRSYP